MAATNPGDNTLRPATTNSAQARIMSPPRISRRIDNQRLDENEARFMRTCRSIFAALSAAICGHENKNKGKRKYVKREKKEKGEKDKNN